MFVCIHTYAMRQHTCLVEFDVTALIHVKVPPVLPIMLLQHQWTCQNSENIKALVLVLQWKIFWLYRIPHFENFCFKPPLGKMESTARILRIFSSPFLPLQLLIEVCHHLFLFVITIFRSLHMRLSLLFGCCFNLWLFYDMKILLLNEIPWLDYMHSTTFIHKYIWVFIIN